MTEKINQQTSVQPELAAQLKVHAAQHGILMMDLYEDAIKSLLNHRRDSRKEGSTLIYATSPHSGKPFNMKITPGLKARVEKAAKQDGVSVRRFLYTALVHYAKLHQLSNIAVYDGH